MDQSEGHTWSHPAQYVGIDEPMATEDFSRYLDFDELDLNGFHFDPANINDAAQDPAGANTMPNPPTTSATDFQLQQAHYAQHQQQQQQMQRGSPKGVTTPMSFGAQTPFQSGGQGFSLNSNHAYQQGWSIPPTPNSSGMYPMPALYRQKLQEQAQKQQQQQQLLSQFQANTRQDASASFTPVMSPEFAAHNALHTQTQQYAVPGAYLSPITSPAMNPQNSANRLPPSQPRTAESSLAPSPMALDLDTNEVSSASSVERPRKTRKKAVIPKSAGPAPRTKSMAIGKRRQGSLSVNIPRNASIEELRHMANGPDVVQLPSSATSTTPNTREGTRSKSISPHPLEEHMGPPPRPIVATPSALPPATPASLMRIQQQKSAKRANTALDAGGVNSPIAGALGPSLEDLRLPDAIEDSRTATPTRQQLAPNIVSSTNASPLPRNMLSPVVSEGGAGAKSDIKHIRGSRKRNSTSSHMISPALRPKISPSIKPLLPDGAHGLSQEAQALLLASKSNYHIMIEGNQIPGVDYNTDLATNLTSKRTSHKIAEQGRRNRINTALQDMQSLLPSPLQPNSRDSDERDEPSNDAKDSAKAQAAAGNSKAATVENAIVYIRDLKKTLTEKDDENEQLRREVMALRAKLGDEESQSSSMDSTA